MAVRPDVRLDDGPMVPVACQACGAQVEARKSSWEQTSLQWDGEAVATCLERRASSAGAGRDGAGFRRCGALEASVREAAVASVRVPAARSRGSPAQAGSSSGSSASGSSGTPYMPGCRPRHCATALSHAVASTQGPEPLCPADPVPPLDLAARRSFAPMRRSLSALASAPERGDCA